MCRRVIALCLAFALATLLFGESHPPMEEYQFLPDQLVVKTTSDNVDLYTIEALSSVIDFSKGSGTPISPVFKPERIKSITKAERSGLFRIYKVFVNKGTDIPELCQKLSTLDEIVWAEPVYIIPQYAVPNDPK